MYSDTLLAAYDEIVASQKKDLASPTTPSSTASSPTGLSMTSSRPTSSSSAFKARKQPAPIETASASAALNSPVSVRGSRGWPRRQDSAVSAASIEEPMV